MELKDPWTVLEGMDIAYADTAVAEYLLDYKGTARGTQDVLTSEAKAMIAACEYFLQQTTGEKPMSEQLAEDRLAFKALSERHQKLHLAAATAYGGLGLALVNIHLPE